MDPPTTSSSRISASASFKPQYFFKKFGGSIPERGPVFKQILGPTGRVLPALHAAPQRPGWGPAPCIAPVPPPSLPSRQPLEVAFSGNPTPRDVSSQAVTRRTPLVQPPGFSNGHPPRQMSSFCTLTWHKKCGKKCDIQFQILFVFVCFGQLLLCIVGMVPMSGVS